MGKKVDQRIAKSQKAIQTAFSEMLLDVGFGSITVKDIKLAQRQDGENTEVLRKFLGMAVL